MRINRTGKIADNFYVLGHSAVPIYLLDGPSPLLFDAGFTGLLHLYEKEIKNVLGKRSPAFLFLTHSHWDHVGSGAYLKEIWPEMKIAGSIESSKILSRSGAIEQIKALNQGAREVLRSWGVSKIHEGEFKPFALDVILEDGQEMEIEKGLTLKVIAVPGHTWDSTAYYIPERKILVAGEAAGCDGVCEFLVDYEAYGASMEFLAGMEVEILCTAHNYVFTGPDVRKYLDGSMGQISEYVGQVKRYLKEEKGDVDRVVTRVKTAEWDEKPLPKQPLEPYLINTSVRVKKILELMKN
ncbi:MAG: MBL fold metallo-hydrolase [Deltaproteobacteria bacterium]|nr:MBL fold metallo-hydrolase [Deltaproteobacteria bacterium]